LAAFLLLGSVAHAGLAPKWRTTKDGVNAVRYGGQIYTLEDLIEKRALNPERFDSYHTRIGPALGLGIDGLCALRERNERRFDRYHGVLGWLLEDCETEPGVGPVVITPPVDSPPPFVPPDFPPDIPPPFVPPDFPPPGGDDNPPPPDDDDPPDDDPPRPIETPEPATWLLALAGGAILGASRLGAKGKKFLRPGPRS
jgi:hypothetical protein